MFIYLPYKVPSLAISFLFAITTSAMDFQAKRTRGGSGKGRSNMPDSAHGTSFRHPPAMNSGNGTSNYRQKPAKNGYGHGNCSSQLPEANCDRDEPSRQLGTVNYGRGNGNLPRQAPAMSSNGQGAALGSSCGGGGCRGLGRGQGGRGRKIEYVPVKPPNLGANTETLTSNMESLEISRSPPKRVPMKRPDGGGSSGIRSLKLLVNHFLVKYDDRAIIYHYEIDIKPEKLPNSKSIAEISKSDSLYVTNKLRKGYLTQTAYDGERNIYSSVQLPIGTLKLEFGHKTYNVSVELKKELKLSALAFMPEAQEVLHGLNVIVREASSWQKISIGRSIYSSEHSRDLGRGVTALQGSKQTLKRTEQGLVLSVDYSVIPCRTPGPVIQFLEGSLGIKFTNNTRLNKKQMLDVKNALKGLRVKVTHRRTEKKFMVFGLTELATEDISFKDENSGEELRLVDYYKNRYSTQIRYKRLPCLDLSQNNMNYMPMEFCTLVEGQKYPKEEIHRDIARKVRDMATAHPKMRKEKILNMVNATDGLCREEIVNQFNISITKDMTQIVGRVLEPPDLKLGNSNGKSCKYKIQREDCQWNFNRNKVSKGQKISHWGILNFSANPVDPRHERLNTPEFIYNIVNGCLDIGIQMGEHPLFVMDSGMAVLSDYKWLSEELSEAKRRAQNRPLQLLICVFSDRHPGYNSLKLLCDTEMGIMTQCCLSYNANFTRKKEQLFCNLGLKINGKLGGSNVELFNSLPRLKDCPFMFIGADVNHPSSWNTSSPSITAVVGTLNCPESNKYAARIRAQQHRKETIAGLGEICKELIDAYARYNGFKPEKIIYFRDGVSDGQFNMVLNEELRDLKAGIETEDYSPTITIVVAQKRHHTRLFMNSNEESPFNKAGNVPPGTIVDTGIVDPSAFNFYLCSHYGSLGTSKPTHYYVLWDDHGFTSDELQKLIYNLCYTFARCTKPVSLVPPVYYADLAAYRGRLYYDELSDSRSPASTRSPNSLSSLSSSSSAPTYFDHGSFPKLHRDVEDVMFFL